MTGWRTKSEILPLQWHQVDFASGTIRLEPGTTKNRDGRVFVFGAIDELRECIDGQWALHQKLAKTGEICSWMFHRNGRPILSYRRA